MNRDYLLHDGSNSLSVVTYTSVPKRVIDGSGEVRDLDQLLFDPRYFADQTEQMVLWWTIQQVLRFENRRQLASGTFSVNEISKRTGYHHKTIWKRLSALQARRMLQYRAAKGTNERGEVTINLRLDQWLPPAARARRPRGLYALPPIQEAA